MSKTDVESTPLLCTEAESGGAFFEKLDAESEKKFLRDHPKCRRRRRVKTHLTHATLPAGHGHPVHHHLQSPSLLLRMEQAIEQGFWTVTCNIHAFFKAKRLEASEQDSSYPIVVTVFVIAVLTMLTMTAIGPTVLLYMNHAGFTHATDISSYVIASSLSSAVPIASNIILGTIGSRFGPGRALSVGALTAALGLVIVLVSRSSLFLFFVGYGLYSVANSLRVIRISILSKVVPENERTTVLATHALMTPIGALMGPLVWIGFQTYRGEAPLLGGLLTFNRFSLDYSVACFALLAIAVIAALRLTSIVPANAGNGNGSNGESAGTNGASGDDSEGQEVTIHYADGTEDVVNLQRYRQRVFLYFCGIMFGVNVSAGVFMTAFQPVLVNVFHTSDAKLGLVFELIAIFAIVPPLLVAILSRYLMDRQIMVIGLCSKIIGMCLFLPIFGEVREWQVIAGFMLIVKASIFFSTASMSLFTKLLGRMSTSSVLGMLASGSNVGPAVAQILLAGHIVQLFGGMGFGVFGMPAVLSLGVIVAPRYWRRLDAGREFTRLLMVEAENLGRSGGE